MAEKPEVLDPEAPPSDEEVAEANRLRDALESGAGGGESAELARALSAAWSPRDLSPADHGALVARSLAHARRRRRVLASRVSFGAGALIALAAGALVVLRGALGPPQSAPVGQVAQVGSTGLISSRSTQSLFAEPFAGTGGQTSRVDRIAMARAADLRENEFARWGIR